MPRTIDWKRTISRNLKNYQPAPGTIVPETVHFFSRAQRSNLWTVIVCTLPDHRLLRGRQRGACAPQKNQLHGYG